MSQNKTEVFFSVTTLHVLICSFVVKTQGHLHQKEEPKRCFMQASVVEFMALWRSAKSISQNNSKRGGSKHYNVSLCCHYLSLPISVSHSLPPFWLHHTIVLCCICSFVIFSFLLAALPLPSPPPSLPPLLSSPLLFWPFDLFLPVQFSVLFHLHPALQQQAWETRMKTWHTNPGERLVCISALFICTLVHV